MSAYPGLLIPPPITSTITSWQFVRRRFELFLGELAVTAAQVEDGETKQNGITARLNQIYWESDSETDNKVLIGSWAKSTRVRPPRDVDMLFVLPYEVYARFQDRSGNKQSQLLQEVKAVLAAKYPTDIRGDGQVVVLLFNSMKVEIAPVFLREGGGYLGCDTSGGGQYVHIDPAAELAALSLADVAHNGNVRKLTRMLKQWQRYCNAPIKSFHMENLVKDLLPTLTYGTCDEFWFDWLIRDCFASMVTKANTGFFMPGTGEFIYLGDEWLSRAESAYQRALKACDYERWNDELLAGEEWQKIFGSMIPRTV